MYLEFEIELIFVWGKLRAPFSSVQVIRCAVQLRIFSKTKRSLNPERTLTQFYQRFEIHNFSESGTITVMTL